MNLVSKDQAAQQLLQIVADALKIERETVTLDSGPLVLPNWDSFFHLHLVMEIEDKYEVTFDPDTIAEMISVREILSALQNKGVVEK